MENLTIQRNTPYSRTIRFKYKDGTSVNLTGLVILFTAKKKTDKAINDDAAVIKKSISSHSDPTTGTTTLTLTAADTNVATDTYNSDFRFMQGTEVIGNTLPFYSYVIETVTKRTE